MLHRHLARTFLLILALGSAVPAQTMSGTYTIDPKGTGNRNFKDFASASYALVKSGISGAVVCDVAAGSYAESFSIGPVAGASAKNTITYRSKTKHGAKLSPQARKPVLTIPYFGASWPVQWYVFDGLVFSSGKAIEARKNSSNIVIRNCKLADSVTIDGDGSEKGWVIHDCNFTHKTITIDAMLSVKKVAEIKIYRNTFALTDAILEVIVLHTSYAGSTRSRFYNNVIFGNTSSSISGGVLDLTAAENLDCDHNSFAVKVMDSVSGLIHVTGQFGKKINIRNNLLYNVSSGYCLVDKASDRFSVVLDSNLYLAGLDDLLAILHNIIGYKTVAAFNQATGQEANGVQADPKLESATNLHLKEGSPAAAKAVGTPAWITTDFDLTARPARATIGAYEGLPPTTWTVFGKGCAGSGGFVPKIGFTGDLKKGSTTFQVNVANALGGLSVRAYLILGFRKQTVSFGGGCNLLVSPDILFLIPVGGQSGAGKGSTGLKIPIPSNAKLKGREAHLQWGVIDPGAKGIRVAMSDAATVKL